MANEFANIAAWALRQAGATPPVKPPAPPVRKPFVPPTAPVTSQYDQTKALYEQELAAAAEQNQAKLAIADRAALPYQSLAKSAESLPGQITAGYDAAAGRSEAFTSAYSQAFRDESAKLQAQNGAENRGAGLGDALAFMGSLPARGYRDSGSGLAEAARSLPTTVGLRGQDAVTEARTTENTAYAKLLSELRSAGGKRLLDAAQQDRTFGLDREKWSYQQWKDTQDANADKSKRAYQEWKDNRDFKYQQGQDAIGMLEKQAAQLSESGLLFQYNPATRTVEPVMGEDGAQIQTTSGITSSQGAVRLRLDVQKMLQDTTRTVWEETPDGGFRNTGVPTGDQQNKLRELGQGDQRISISQQHVAIANGQLRLSGDTASRQAAQYLADKLSEGTNEDGSRTIYTVRQTKDGWAVATALNPTNGKPLTAKQQGFTLAQERKLKIGVNDMAKNAKNGITSKPGNAEFFDAEGKPVTVKPNDPSKGWSQETALRDSSGGVAYINHYPALSYDDAAKQMIVDSQYPPALAYEALNRVYKPGEQGRPGQSPGNRKVASGYSLGDVGKVPPNITVAPNVVTQTVDNRLLSALGQLQTALGVDVQIISGFRSQQQQAEAYQRYVDSGFDPSMIAAKPGLSNHQRGQAVDVMVNGKPIGDVIPADVLARFGIHNPVKGDGPHTTLLDVNG